MDGTLAPICRAAYPENEIIYKQIGKRWMMGAQRHSSLKPILAIRMHERARSR
jgi:hypothetical protein